MRRRNFHATAAAVLTAACGFGGSPAAGAETIRIAFIEVLSGPFGLAGQASLAEIREVARRLEATRRDGDPTIEIVPFDGKGSPQESAAVLRSAIDQGIRYVTQGGGSGVAFTLADAIAKQAQRDPGKSMILLNYAAADPGLTGDRCSYWHFRFSPSSEMQINMLAGHLGDRKEVRKVYLINQNYTHGQQVARAARTFIPVHRPDIEIVGEDLVPLGTVRDFGPYVGKIAASGADTVITSNWGSDLALLVRAAQDYGLNVNLFTLSAMNPGIPTQLGTWGAGKVHVVWNWIPNADDTPALEKLAVSHKEKTGQEFTNVAHWNSLFMLREAIRKARSTDPAKVASALEGLDYDSPMGKVHMRASDHQLQAPIYIGTWGKQGSPGIRHDSEKTGFGFRTTAVWPAARTAMPSSCKMPKP